MRSAVRAPAFAGAFRTAGTGFITPITMAQMTMPLFGLAIYLFCVHSFKLPIAAGGIAIGLLGVLLAKDGVSIPAPVAFFAGFLAWSTVGLFTSQYSSSVGQALIDYLKILLILFVAINSARTKSQLGIFVGLWVLMFGVYPARGTFFNYMAGINEFGRYGWNFSFANFNDLAAFSILAMSLSAFLWLGQFPKWIKRGGMLSTAGLALLIIITQSRGAFIGLVVAFALMMLRSRNRVKMIRGAVLASLLIVVLAPKTVWDRFARMKFLTDTETIGEADTSAEQRWVILQVALTIAKDHLGGGVGLGAYAETHARYAEERQEWAFGGGNRDAHNMYVSIAAETGLPGLALFLGMLGATLLRAARVEKLLRASSPSEAEQLRILRFGLIAYLIAAIFGSFHRVSFLYLYLAVLWSASELFKHSTSAPVLQPSAAPVPQLRSRIHVRHRMPFGR
jgi:O-antigen ligase